MKKATWWRNSLTGMGVLALVSAASPAAAQRYSRDDPRDQYQDRQELGQDRVDVRADWMDVRRVQQAIAQLRQARDERNPWREDRARRTIRELFRNEIVEARHDAYRDQNEVYRSSRERMRDRSFDGQRDLRDDQTDLTDSSVRFRELNRTFRAMRDNEPAARAHSWRAMRYEDQLLARFLQITREDAISSGRELNEDRYELREDHGG